MERGDLEDVEALVSQEASRLNVQVLFFQSNHEGDIIDLLQVESCRCHGIIINAGALTHYGLSLRDALSDTRLPVVEVHISNIYGRDLYRRQSVIAPLAVGYIAGLGWRSYAYALRGVVDYLRQ